jgi:hypothetical protein
MANTPLGFPFGFYVADNSPIDGKYGIIASGAWRPYNNVAEALSSVPVGIRYIGLTVNISSTEYWWENGVTDPDLVVKSGGAGITFGAAGQVPFTNAGSDGFLYSNNFSWDDISRRLTIGTGNTNVQGIDNYILAPNSQILIGSWNLITGEEHIIRNVAGSSGGVNNNAFLGGYLNLLEQNGAGYGIYNSVFLGGHDNVITGNKVVSSVIYGKHNKIIGASTGSMVGGSHTETTGYSAWAHGDQTTNNAGDFSSPTPVQNVLAAGRHAFNFSANSPAQTVGHGALSEYSAILAGLDHNIPSDSPRSVILGGNAIKARATAPDQVYVPNLNIVTGPLNDNALTQILVRDNATGLIKYRDASSVGGGSIGGSTGFTDNAILRADGTGGVTLQSSNVIIDDTANIILGTTATSGGPRTITPDGSGTDIGVTIIGKGNGTVRMSSSTGTENVSVSPSTGQVGLTASQNISFLTTSGVILSHVGSATTNTVLRVANFRRSSTSTPAVGIGGSIGFEVETSVDNFENGAVIEAVTTDVTSASEDFDLAFRTMSGGSPATEKVRITSDGALLNGATSNIVVNGANLSSYIARSDYSQTGLFAYGPASHQMLVFGKSRNATINAHTAVLNLESLGMINFMGSDGDEFISSALISASVDGTVSNGAVPGKLNFSTAAGGGSPNVKLSITSTSVNLLVGVAFSSGPNTQTTLTLDRSKTLYAFTGSSAATWTLPAVTGNTGLTYFIKNRGSANVVVQRAGADNLYTSSAVTSITILPGESRTIINDGAIWNVL